ncbi:hypothetical protein N7528_002205 [Penicillium herquei]|nr:hypothetical protein N7528_002205 [Penicillium herquei]
MEAGPAVAPAPNYGVRYTKGVTYQKWIDNDVTAGVVCPFGPTQLRIGDLDSCTIFKDDEIDRPWEADESESSRNSRSPSHEPVYIQDPGKPGDPPGGTHKKAWSNIDMMKDLFQVTLPFGNDKNAPRLLAHRVVKYDPFECAFEQRQREGQFEDLRAASLAPANSKDIPSNIFMTVIPAWDGIVTKGTMVIAVVRRHTGQAYMHEVTNAIYTHLAPENGLKYIFLKDIRNIDTRSFIQHQLYGPPNGSTFPPPAGAFPNPRHFLHGSAEYHALLGTEIGRMIGRFVLGRYPHGSCKIARISVSLSGLDTAYMKDVDMMFELEPTLLPLALPETPYTSSSEEPEDGNDDGGGGGAPDRGFDPDGQNLRYNRYREAMARKRAAEEQDLENESRVGRTRSGKQRLK